MDKQVVNKNFDNFIKKLSFRYCEFINFKDENRRYTALDSAIKDFLENNGLGDVSVKRLRDYWTTRSFNNASHKFSVDRNNFLFGIIIVRTSFSSNVLMGKKLHVTQRKELEDRFRSVIESVGTLEDFNRKLLGDLFDFENIESIEEFEYEEEKVNDFINKYYKKYVKYFQLQGLRKKEQEKLTKYAIEHFLLEEDTINELLEGQLENAN